MGKSTNESVPNESIRPAKPELEDLAGAAPEAWSHGAFLASWSLVAFDEPRSLEGDLKAINRHFRKLPELGAEIHEHARRYQETGKPIAEREAVALVERIKSLTPHFDGRPDYIAFLAGHCLTLQEGQAAGEVFTKSVQWEAGEAIRADAAPAFWWRTVILAVPAELQFSGPDSAFGVQSAFWLHRQCEAVACERARRDFPPGSPARRMYDGGYFAIPLLDFPVAAPVRAGPAVSVVPAPVEDTIREYVKRARSDPDYWDALVCVVDVLNKCGQPLGDWVVRRGNRPDGRKAAKAPKKALRNHAMKTAVRALVLCGIPPTRNRDKRWLARAHGWEGEIDPDYNPPSGCAIVAKVLGMSARAVEEVLKPVPE